MQLTPSYECFAETAIEAQGIVPTAPSPGDVLPMPDDYYPPIPDFPSSPPRQERLSEYFPIRL